MPQAEFRVEQGGLPDCYFAIIKKTFTDLHLAENYRDSCGREIERLKDCCCNYFIKNQNKGLDDCLRAVADVISDTKVNYWVNVLYKSLVVAEEFKRFVMKSLTQEYEVIVEDV